MRSLEGVRAKNAGLETEPTLGPAQPATIAMGAMVARTARNARFGMRGVLPCLVDAALRRGGQRFRVFPQDRDKVSAASPGRCWRLERPAAPQNLGTGRSVLRAEIERGR